MLCINVLPSSTAFTTLAKLLSVKTISAASSSGDSVPGLIIVVSSVSGVSEVLAVPASFSSSFVGVPASGWNSFSLFCSLSVILSFFWLLLAPLQSLCQNFSLRFPIIMIRKYRMPCDNHSSHLSCLFGCHRACSYCAGLFFITTHRTFFVSAPLSARHRYNRHKS